MPQRVRRRNRRDHDGGKRPSQPVVSPGASGGWYRPLRQADVVRIHEASLDVLEKIGIEVQPSECRDIWQAAGATIDTSRNRVFIPRSLVQNALNSAQNEVFLAGRNARHDMHLGGKRVYMGTGGAAVKILDLDSQQVRQTTLRDVAEVGRLVDALDNIHFYLRCCVARNIPPEDLDLNTYYAAFSSTTKHVTGNCFTVRSLHEVLAMAELIAGGREALRERPFLSFITSWTVSPLRFAAETVEVLTEIVRQQMPVFLSSAPQAGATSPAALAGTLVQIHAEELSGLTYCQLVKPGTPVVLGYVPSVSDLRTGNFVGGAAEFALMNAAVAQLGQYCHLPVYNSSGLSDAKLPDVQAGYEKGITGAAAALAGANYIHHSAGFLESMLTVAYEQFVIDDDINGSIMRLVRGIEVTDETLSLDVIEQVVNGEGHFLGTQQSLELMNSEFYYPHTADRQSRDNWQADGGLDMRQAARRKAKKLLKTHRPDPLPPPIDNAIRERFNILLPEK
ncbi:MAG: trimethylamine methyltransferase family protein [Ardenticatenaceae bacterium]|nr:trimethylamine methyltransferase family protein [Ardenticatenaceae bacterium]